MVLWVTAGILSILVYFLPTFIAGYREHHQTGAIVVINLFFGWTFIGWVIALAMACSSTAARASSVAHGAMWAPDPVGRVAWRWWDGYRWTEHALDAAGRQVVDPV